MERTLSSAGKCIKLSLRSSIIVGINDSILWSDEYLSSLRTFPPLQTNTHFTSFCVLTSINGDTAELGDWIALKVFKFQDFFFFFFLTGCKESL